MPPGVTVVVGTFDLYEAAWPVMCHGLEKYWPGRPSSWKVAFIVDKKTPPRFSAIRVGTPKGWDKPDYWSTRIISGLRQIEADVILWTSEDNWLAAPVDMGALLDFAGYIRDGAADHIRLYPGWDHDLADGKFWRDSRLLTFKDESPYRCSLKPALWRKDTFQRLLRAGEAAWEFERNASRRSRRYGKYFMAVADWGYFPIVTKGDPSGNWAKSPIVKGRWTKAAKAYCDREGLKVDFSKHPVGRILDDKLRKVDWVLP